MLITMNPAAYDGQNRALDFTFEIEPSREGDLKLYAVHARNDQPQPVEVERFHIFTHDTGEASLRAFKSGMRSPGDPSRFYTLTINTTVPYSGWQRSDCMRDFDEYDLCMSTMGAYESGGGFRLIGAVTFDMFHAQVVFRAGADSVSASMWLEGDYRRFDPGEWVELETICVIDGAFDECLDAYGRHLAARHGSRRGLAGERGLAGWSDWEFYRNDKTQEDILRSAGVMSGLMREGWPLSTVCVDGGWAENLAEWSRAGKNIPGGIPALFERMAADGIRPGIWFAPYITNAACDIVKGHPEWLLKDRETGEALTSGDSNVGPKRTMDYSAPGALDYLRGVIRMLVSWGMRYLKLDGPVLTHYLGGRFYDPYSTRLKQINDTLRIIREECGEDVLIESEGVYGPAIGIADCHRICQDEHPFWYDPVDGHPILKDNLVTSIMSAWCDRHFWLNLNMLILRDVPSPFYYHRTYTSEHLREVLATDNELRATVSETAISGGAIFYSAPLEYTVASPRQMDMLARTLPVAGRIDTRPVDTENDEPGVYETYASGRHLASAFNWGETYRSYSISLSGPHHVYDYWECKYLGVYDGVFSTGDIAPRSCGVYRLTECTGEPCVVGVDSHILQLSEESALGGNQMSIRLTHPAGIERRVTAYIPAGMEIERVETDARDILTDARQEMCATFIYNANSAGVTTIDVYLKHK